MKCKSFKVCLMIWRGVDNNESLKSFERKKIPKTITWMVIIGQIIGSIALLIGFSGRITALGNFIIFT